MKCTNSLGGVVYESNSKFFSIHDKTDITKANGEFCVLLGPSGSGKSTLLNIIGGIDTPDSGYVSINGDKLTD